eukprot:11410435-Alexandrium_andersonii.AAC.1
MVSCGLGPGAQALEHPARLAVLPGGVQAPLSRGSLIGPPVFANLLFCGVGHCYRAAAFIALGHRSASLSHLPS